MVHTVLVMTACLNLLPRLPIAASVVILCLLAQMLSFGLNRHRHVRVNLLLSCCSG